MQNIKNAAGYLIDEYGVIVSQKRNYIMNGSISNTGYKQVHIRFDNGHRKTVKIHRLVALTFIPNPENKPQVNHIDGNKLNNHVSNLEWNTCKENLEHAVNVLKKDVYFKTGANHPNAKLNNKKVKKIREKYKKGGHTYRSLAKDYGVSSLVINQVIHNRIWVGV